MRARAVQQYAKTAKFADVAGKKLPEWQCGAISIDKVASVVLEYR